PAAQEPTGLKPGEAVAPPTAPEVTAPAVEGGGASSDAAGEPDPAAADHWAQAGSHALEQSSSSAAGTAPEIGGQLRPLAQPQEVTQLHTNWGTERATILEGQRSGVEAEAGQTRTEASRQLSEANAQAKAKADEAEKSQPDGEQKSSGWWGKIKAVGSKVAGA